jgi:hypothetical protein
MKKLKKINRIILTVTLITLSFFILESCKKSEGLTHEEPTKTSIPDNPQLQISDADAILVGLQTVTYTSAGGFPIETAIGLPMGMFFDGTNFKNVGTVTCEDKPLTKQDNNSYVFTPSSSTPLGVTYDNELNWTVAGANGFPGGTYSAKASFPSNIEIDAVIGQNVDTKSAFTLATKIAASNSDSVYFGIYGPSGGINHVVGGNTSSYTFSEAEMKSVGTGVGFMQIAAIKQVKREVLSNGEVIYYLTEKVNTTSVTLN